MEEKLNVSFGKASPKICRAFRNFLEAFHGDVVDTLGFLIKRNVHPMPISATEKKEELFAEAEKSTIGQLFHLIDSFMLQHNLTSREDAIEVLVSGCGIEWEDNVTLSLTSGHHHKILEKLNKDRKEDKFCDMNIFIGEDDSYPVHRCILAAASEFFADLFQADTKFIRIINMAQKELFTDVLEFIYSGMITINDKNYTKLSEMAKFLQITSLQDICKEYSRLVFQSKLREENSHESLIVLTEDTERPKKTSLSETSDFKTYIIDGNYPPPDDVTSDDTEDCCSDFIDEERQQRDCNNNEKNDNSEGSGSDYQDIDAYTCTTCSSFFHTKNEYCIHQLSHIDNPPYQCSACSKVFLEKSLLTEHVCEMHLEKIVCYHCPEVFMEADTLARHLEDFHKVTHQTPSPQSSTSIKKTLIRKRKTGLRSRRFTCMVCKSVFRTRSHLKRHMISHSGERKHCCTTCGKLFLKADHLTRHERTHSTERPFSCDECDKKFKTKHNLKRHHQTHSNERPFFCELCAKQFKDLGGLQIHQRSHNKSERICPHCGKCFKQQNRLAYHILRHKNPPICAVCGKTFTFETQLRKHMMSHSGVRPFNCETCGKQFGNVHGLKLHQKKHTGIGLHACSLCDRKFLDNFHLQRHMKTHTGEKPFTCKLCNRSFSRADNCDNHKRKCEVKSARRKNMQSFTEERGKTKIKRMRPNRRVPAAKKDKSQDAVSNSEAISKIAVSVNSDEVTSCRYKRIAKKLPELKLVVLKKDKSSVGYDGIAGNCSALAVSDSSLYQASGGWR